MNQGVGAFRVFAWGLRKYAWLIALSVLAVGVLLPALQARTADVYEASALVAPNRLTATTLDMVPRYGDRVFENGEVASSVREALGLADAEADVTPSRVELISEQDNPSFTVIGRDENPDEAVRLADIAAATFTREMNSTTVESVGSFEIQSTADRPGEPVPAITGGRFAVVLGALAGLLAGVGIVGLLLLLRRPVLDGTTATELTRTTALGKVTLPHSRADRDVSRAAGIAPLARRLLAADPTVIMLVSPADAAPQRTQLASLLATVLGRVGPVRLVQGEEVSGPLALDRSGAGELVLIDAPAPDELATRPETAMMLLVVPEGISERSLRQAAEDHLDGDGWAGVVLVDRDRGWRRPKRATSSADGHPKSRAGKSVNDSGTQESGFFDMDPETDTDERPRDSASANDTSRSGATARH
ncbi:MAG: hypothetical protein K0Q93_2088 [Nocardioidaceae bacterium]|jgi:capsular polysaccharide biosynthesis protein|nr:hypothetical protein [Nocardioidaceae bacterium]